MSEVAETPVTGAKRLYTANTHTTGGRERGISRSSDGRLDIKLSVPGGPGAGTNPEQLLAAGWSACFEGAIGHVSRAVKVGLPEGFSIDAEVDLNLAEKEGYFLSARLNVNLPGVDRAIAQKLVDAAANTCPYSKALKGNVDVEYIVKV